MNRYNIREAFVMPVSVTTIRRFLPIVVLAAAACRTATVGAADAKDPARVQRAITYLDGRQDAWSEFPRAGRGEGADRTACVSCHTGISYALARPSLGRLAAEPGSPSGLPAAEQRMITGVRLRVEHWAELDSDRFGLMYDSDDRKKAESRGTEAVLSALILARADAARGQMVPSPATKTALVQLWATQAKDGNDSGSWDWLNFGLAPWEAGSSRAFGAALAALAVGAIPSYLEQADGEAARGTGLLRDYLRRRFPDENLFNRLWILDASMTFEGVLTASERRDVVAQLLALRRDDGGWALATFGGYKRVDRTAQAQDSDGYATGLAVHVLLRAGLPADRPELARGLAWLRSHQQEDGSWPGRSVNKERDPATFIGKLMTDAATAVAAQALVEAGAP
jgi:squalene-hopene/tetraprenyl-beta-curcumene cyclase